ncbi:hypothetical protein [Natrialba sp. PRR66]|uniref:hypothetical protein n=1 Tax=Natrialba sp. PRR66 TaxID=3098146 RepID=UPI002B1E24B1|nr:hypothetical protein [Natrialba sp. PRR66]
MSNRTLAERVIELDEEELRNAVREEVRFELRRRDVEKAIKEVVEERYFHALQEQPRTVTREELRQLKQKAERYELNGLAESLQILIDDLTREIESMKEEMKEFYENTHEAICDVCGESFRFHDRRDFEERALEHATSHEEFEIDWSGLSIRRPSKRSLESLFDDFKEAGYVQNGGANWD